MKKFLMIITLALTCGIAHAEKPFEREITALKSSKFELFDIDTSYLTMEDKNRVKTVIVNLEKVIAKLEKHVEPQETYYACTFTAYIDGKERNFQGKPAQSVQQAKVKATNKCKQQYLSHACQEGGSYYGEFLCKKVTLEQ